MSNIKDLTDANFASEIASGLTFVDFWADWCTPCKAVAPIVDELAETYKDKIKFAKLDTDANTETAMKYEIMSIPRFIIFKDGQPFNSAVGAMPKAMFVQFIEETLKM